MYTTPHKTIKTNSTIEYSSNKKYIENKSSDKYSVPGMVKNVPWKDLLKD